MLTNSDYHEIMLASTNRGNPTCSLYWIKIKNTFNKVSIIIKIKETKEQLLLTKHPAWRKMLESDLKCYLAIKDLFDRSS